TGQVSDAEKCMFSNVLSKHFTDPIWTPVFLTPEILFISAKCNITVGNKSIEELYGLYKVRSENDLACYFPIDRSTIDRLALQIEFYSWWNIIINMDLKIICNLMIYRRRNFEDARGVYIIKLQAVFFLKCFDYIFFLLLCENIKFTLSLKQLYIFSGYA
ncbi:hypothetical protein ACJX0J_018809, partial [Zea mays]